MTQCTEVSRPGDVAGKGLHDLHLALHLARDATGAAEDGGRDAGLHTCAAWMARG